MRDATHQPIRDVRLSLGGTLITGLVKTVVWVVFAAFLSVIVEWVLMSTLWRDQGVQHSAEMLRQERAYLARAANAIPMINDQGVVRSAEGWTALGVRWSGLKLASAWGREFGFKSLSEYIAAAINTLSVFISRLFVLLLATPAFLVFGAVGLVRGLVARELRKWSGGRETSGTYHLALRALPDVTLGLWVIYLAMPVSVNPFVIVGPVVISFALVLQQLAYRFKKYV